MNNCRACNGSGRLFATEDPRDGTEICHFCKGKGKTREPICPKHKLKISTCNCKEMQYKQHLKVPRLLAEITDTELENLWWKAFRRDDLSTVYCDPHAFRIALAKIINGTQK